MTAYNNQYNAVAAASGTAAANTAAAADGESWTAGVIDALQVGSPPPVGTFPVTVNPTAGPASSIDFGFDPGLVYNQPLVYGGPSGAKAGIVGLTSGTIYYVRLPEQGSDPDVIQLADSNGNIIPISLASGSTTTVDFAALTYDSVTVGTAGPLSSTLTFNDAGDPTTPFDPGYNQGDPFIYEGAVNPAGGDVDITGLSVGQTYYVLLSSTPGVIQLSATPGGPALPISLPDGTTTNINYTVPFTPVNSNPPVVTSLGSINTGYMSGSAQTLNPVDSDGITINAGLSAEEYDFASTTFGGVLGLQDELLRPEAAAPGINSWFTSLMEEPPDSSSSDSGANSPPASTVEEAPGGTGDPPPFSLVGTFVVEVDVDTVHADVAATAVLESGANITVSASMSQTADTGTTASVSRSETEGGAAVALAVAFGFSDPHVLATIDNGAQVDAAGTLSVTANTDYPFEIPTTVNGVEGDVVYNPANSTYNPLAFVTNFIADGQLGLGTDIFNNSASATASAEAVDSVGVAGTIQIFIYVNDTEATIGDALINQKVSDPNALGTGQGITFRNSGQSVSVESTTTYENISSTGVLQLNVAPAEISELLRGTGQRCRASTSTGGTEAGGAFGASIAVYALDDTTIAQIDTGAKITIGSGGSLDVDANQQVIAISLVQAGGAAGGDIGFAGSFNWYNLTSTTRAQIEDGVTVNAGYDTSNQPLPAGAVTVHADDNMIVVGVTGGAVTGDHVGIGFSAAVNNINRTTLALIGSTSTPTMPGSFTVGALKVNATNEGMVGGVSYAGAVVSPSEGEVAPANTEGPRQGGLRESPSGRRY